MLVLRINDRFQLKNIIQICHFRFLRKTEEEKNGEQNQNC